MAKDLTITESNPSPVTRPARLLVRALQFEPTRAGPERFGLARMNSREIENMRTQLMTLREVAHYLRVHPATVYRLVKAGRLPAIRVGRDLRFDVRVVDAWVASGGSSASPALKRDK